MGEFLSGDQLHHKNLITDGNFKQISFLSSRDRHENGCHSIFVSTELVTLLKI